MPYTLFFLSFLSFLSFPSSAWERRFGGRASKSCNLGYNIQNAF